MRVALYHPWVYLKGGIERMLLELLRRSRHDWTLYTHHFDPAGTFPEFGAAPVVELSPRVPVRRTLPHLVKAVRTISTARLPRDGSRALLVSSESLGDFILTRNAGVPAVCYCHTPLKILHDPSTRRALGARDRPKALVLSAIGPVFNAADRRLWRRYRRVFVNSEEVRGRILRAGLSPDDRIEILPPGVDLERFPFGSEPREPFFLVAGRIMWQKGIELAIDAIAELHREGTPASLVIAGKVDEKSVPYLRSLRQRAEGLPVTFETDPSDDRLASLYRSCLAVVFTPPSEDFGMVPLEAMSAGAVVLAVDGGGARESVIDGRTGRLLPADPVAFGRAMTDVFHAGEALDPMRLAGRERAASFSWESFAARIDDAMERAASLPPGGGERGD